MQLASIVTVDSFTHVVNHVVAFEVAVESRYLNQPPHILTEQFIVTDPRCQRVPFTPLPVQCNECECDVK